MSSKQGFKRHVYLNLKTLDDARAIFLNRFSQPLTPSENISVTDALDRITAEPVFARFSSPSFHSAAMDGIAVMAEDTYGASPDRPRVLAMGRNAFYVNTGHLLPMGANAVIMIENVEELAEDQVQIESAAYPWQHVRKVGEDLVATEMILPQGSRLGPYELGALVAGGVLEIAVKRKPRVVIIPTGSELVSPLSLADSQLQPGQVVEFNSVILQALVQKSSGLPLVYDIIKDDYQAILDALRRAANERADLIIINAGSSAGSEDYTATAIAELGEVLVHGVTIMPGKPTILGDIAGTPIIGNPGYPVSAVISFEQFGAPLLAKMLGIKPETRPRVEITPSQALPSKLGLEEFLRVKLGKINDRIVAAPLPRGAGSITTLTRADGIIRIPVDSEGVGTADTVEAELIKTIEEIEGAVIAIGSHDNTLDTLGDLLRKKFSAFSLSSGNVGSLGGLLTLKRGFSHLAGAHLLDTETGDYNFSYIRKHLAGLPLRLVNLVTREQGFIVAKGNPKSILNFQDLLRNDVRFVNRQAGSGTRILLDYNLTLLGLNTDGISGYENDEFTHMAVAVAVLSGRADAGLAIYSSAKALNLDFVPVTTERYDLVIPESFWNEPKIKALIEIIRTDEFKTAVTNLGGYGVEQTGQVLWKWDGLS
jgi:putative molybdopterin biosynthesis protein